MALLEESLVNWLLRASHSLTEYYFLWDYGGWHGVAALKMAQQKKAKSVFLFRSVSYLS